MAGSCGPRPLREADAGRLRAVELTAPGRAEFARPAPASLRVAEADVGDLAEFRDFVRKTAAALHADNDSVPDLVVAVDEALTNIIRHGYGERRGPVEVVVAREGNSIVVRVRDEAPAFDPTTWPAPDLGLPLERRRAGGLGILLLRRSVDRVMHRARAQSGNELILVKAG